MSAETTSRESTTGGDDGDRRHAAIIEVEGASKAFGAVEVLDKVDLTVEQGEIFALIGPSGCGKTTLIELLVGQAVPTEGEVAVRGRSPVSFGTAERQEIGYMPQGFVLYPSLTVEQNAKFVAGLYGLGWRARRRQSRLALGVVELWDVRKRRAQNISGGMQRRLALACALLHQPSVLFLDEPTAALDPMLRNTIWEHLGEQRENGVTVFVTTQFLDEADRCDRIGVMQAGQLIAIGTPGQLRERALGGQAIDLTSDQIERADVEALQAMDRVHHVELRAWDRVRLIVDDAPATIPEVSNLLRDRDVNVESINTYEPSFDEVFTTLLNRRPGA